MTCLGSLGGECPPFLTARLKRGQEPGLLSGGYTPSKMLLTSRGERVPRDDADAACGSP